MFTSGKSCTLIFSLKFSCFHFLGRLLGNLTLKKKIEALLKGR